MLTSCHWQEAERWVVTKFCLTSHNKLPYDSVLILFSVVSKPWIECPDNIRQVLAPGKDKADVSAVWKLPVSNVQEMKINPPEISKDYLFPPGMTKVDWTVSNSAGTASCSMYVTISGKWLSEHILCLQNDEAALQRWNSFIMSRYTRVKLKTKFPNLNTFNDLAYA